MDQVALSRAPHVLLLGAVALAQFFPDWTVTRNHGQVWKDGLDRTYMTTFHPAAVLRNRAFTRAWRLDLEAFASLVNEGDHIERTAIRRRRQVVRVPR